MDVDGSSLKADPQTNWVIWVRIHQMNQVNSGNECAMMTDTTVIYNTDTDMLVLVLLQLHISNIVMPVIHCESKKTRHYNIVYNFAKCWPIFKLLSLTDSLVNLQQNLD